MINYNEIDKARRLLELGQTATLKEIKNAYRRLAHIHHPDKHTIANEEDRERMKNLNRAYKVLMDYCADYKYSFEEGRITPTHTYDEEMRKWRKNWFNSI